MSSDFSYSSQFILDKKYYTECFEQSAKVESFSQAYFKALFFSIFGAVLVLFTPINAYVAWFLFTLGIVEALSVYYKKPWWVTRQMLSKASKSEVTLTIDENAISSQSFYIDDVISWQDINQLIQTDKGWVIVHSQGKNYISASFLNQGAAEYLQQKAQYLSAQQVEK